ncbi:hypothetical protein AAVH_05518 [Aphelenchoides avenae]|nr:hypothetical protein AAVH_05518 [Aphelenchus avenae]
MSVATIVAVLRYICFDFEDIGDEVFLLETGAKPERSTTEHMKPTNKEPTAAFTYGDVDSTLFGATHYPQSQSSVEEAATSDVTELRPDLNNNDQCPSDKHDHENVTSDQVVNVVKEESMWKPTIAVQESSSEKPDASAECNSSSPKTTGQVYFDKKRVHDFLKDEGTAYLEVVPVLDILLEILSEKSNRPLTLDEITSKPVPGDTLAKLGVALEGLRLLTTFSPAHRCMYWEMVNKSVGEFRLTNRHGVYTTLQKYYELKHGVRLRFPCMPLIRICPDQKIPIPVELLVVTDLPHCIAANIDLALSQD